MSRYIDADELIVIGLDDPDCEHQFKFVPWEFIENALTADVVEVVRCKDCFYAKPYNAKWQLPIKEGALWCTHHEEEKPQGWFCADAIERMVKDAEIH